MILMYVGDLIGVSTIFLVPYRLAGGTLSLLAVCPFSNTFRMLVLLVWVFFPNIAKNLDVLLLTANNLNIAIE